MQLFNITEEEWEEFEEKMNMALDLAGQLNNIWGQFNEFQNNRDKKELQDYRKTPTKKRNSLTSNLTPAESAKKNTTLKLPNLMRILTRKRPRLPENKLKERKHKPSLG